MRMVRTDDFSQLPSFQVRNDTAAVVDVVASVTLETPGGELTTLPPVRRTLAPGATIDLAAGPAGFALPAPTVLFRATVTTGDKTAESFSTIVGRPQPVARDGDFFIGMNAHLHRYSPEEQWRMLQHMRDAGVRTVRLEPGFRTPDESGRFAIDPRIEQSQLAIEAFGMNTLMSLTFFPREYYLSPDKNRMAWAWARHLGEHFKGRVFDYQYGNETNSGWAGHGAAATMSAHNQAMALGTLAADPSARPATFGIAEAQPHYLAELLRNGLSPYIQAVTVHPYSGTAEAGIAKLEANQRVIAAHAAATGQPPQQLWATEIGFHFHEGGPVNPVTRQLTQVNGFTLEQQAGQLARLYLLARSKRIERIYWYNLYGKNDRETFWLLDENFLPRPAWHTLVHLSSWLNDSIPLGGTVSTEPVQKHLFRRADGTLFLAVWALRDGVRAPLSLLPGGHYTAIDANGRPDSANTDALQNPSPELTLGETPLLITGFPEDASRLLTGYDHLAVLANTLDARNWSTALNRWTLNPGDTVSIPWVIFNSGAAPVTARPVVVSRMPGWTIELPEPVAVAAGETVTREIRLTAPRNAVRGVEYRFSFATETEGPRRSLPFETRLWIDGPFPYRALLAESPQQPHYPVRLPFDDDKTENFGCRELLARRAPASMTPDSIDGNLSKWTADEFVTLDQGGLWILRDPQPPVRENWFGRVALRWDATHLYFAFIALDDDLSVVDLTSRDWRDADNVRLFLSAEPDPAKRSRTITARDLLLLMTPTRQFHDEPPALLAAPIGGHVRQDFESQVKIASRVWQGGYLIEAAIPFSAIDVKPAAGLRLGANVLADDADHGFRTNTWMTCLRSADYWNNPQTLGTLTLLP
ncbi:alpha-galactosidase [Opitutaceae bacterium TAV5]|nr:alpha-galactosidase [Opitutaceae bacterium TAV5]